MCQLFGGSITRRGQHTAKPFHLLGDAGGEVGLPQFRRQHRPGVRLHLQVARQAQFLVEPHALQDRLLHRPEAVEALRALRKSVTGAPTGQEIKISASDPLNLVGIILPGPRVAAVPSNFIVLRDGIAIRTVTAKEAPVVPVQTAGSARKTPTV